MRQVAQVAKPLGPPLECATVVLLEHFHPLEIHASIVLVANIVVTKASRHAPVVLLALIVFYLASRHANNVSLVNIVIPLPRLHASNVLLALIQWVYMAGRHAPYARLALIMSTLSGLLKLACHVRLAW